MSQSTKNSAKSDPSIEPGLEPGIDPGIENSVAEATIDPNESLGDQTGDELGEEQAETISDDSEAAGEQVSSEESEDSMDSDFDDHSREQLVEQLVDTQNQIAEMQDGYVRAKAEVENIQRRSQNEMVSARKYAIEGFAQELLTVLDSLDQASKVEMDQGNGEAVVKMQEGLELTVKLFAKVMEKFGVTAVEADTGVKFDPEIHQAISMVESTEVPADHILSVMQKGFLIKDRLLRPAMVVIAKNA